MFANTNKAVMREIGQKKMHTQKLRNIMAILSIALTTLLITTIFTVGITFFDTIERGTEIAPGPMADGGVVAPLSAYGKITEMKEVEWAAYVRPCNLGSLHNREMIGITAVLLAPNQEFYLRNKVNLLNGRFPQKAGEIAISNTMAMRLGTDKKVGDSYTLRLVVPEANRQVEKEIPVIITGIYTSPIEPLSSIYEEIYTAESFLTDLVPEMNDADAIIYISLQSSIDEDFVYDKLLEINSQVGGNGVKYMMPLPVSVFYYFVLLLPVALIMLCGYMLIYNVFYLSIVNDIRFFGLLKTLGTSGRQLKTLLIWQTVRLAAAGILLGLVLGYAVGNMAVPVVLYFTDYGDFYKPSPSLAIFLFSALFSIITILLSCRKPYRTAMNISPVEAAKYEEKNSRLKKIITAVSFSSSSVIFLTAFTMTLGYDVEAMVDRYNTADVRITQVAMIYGSEEEYMPITQEMLAKLKEIPFVENVIPYYTAKQVESAGSGCSYAIGQIKMLDILKSEYNRCIEQGIGWMRPAENGDIRLGIQGLPLAELHREEPNIEVLEGSLDEEKFAQGGYVIYNQGTYQTRKLTKDGIRAGDRLSLSFYDPDLLEYVDKTMVVMAVVERINPFPTGILSDCALTLSNEDFNEIYPMSNQMIHNIQIDTSQELSQEQYKLIENSIQESFNSQLSIRSRYTDRLEFQVKKISMTLLALFLSCIFGMIGLCNIINTQVTDIISRKMEFATMQSIGMTRRQMMLMIFRNSLILCSISSVSAILPAILMTYLLTKMILSFSGFSLSVFVLGCILLFCVIVAASAVISLFITLYLNKKTVVERLREAE